MVMFVGAILLATAGAGAFLSLGDDLGERAREAGERSLASARTTVEVAGLQGRILGGGSALDALNITARLGPGSDPITLDHLVLRLGNRTAERTLHRADAAGLGNYTVLAIRDADGSVAAHRRLNDDDLVTLDANLSAAANDLLLPPREALRIDLLPDPGAPVRLELTTPPTYAGRTIVTLR
jgi:archaellin